MMEVERNITRNAPLCDGTPRFERGYRPHVKTVGPDMGLHGPQKRWWVGPLFQTEADASAWTPTD
jgi:hypothetical protein